MRIRPIRVARLAFAALLPLAACRANPGTAPAPHPLPPRPPEAAPMTDPGVDPPVRNALPPVPPRDGLLRIDVAYPAEGAALTTADSNFIFGTVGTGRATLTINGAPVEVAPNGAFLGFVPVPWDGLYRLRATVGGQTAELERRVREPTTITVSSSGILSSTITPRGVMTAYPGERVTVRFRGRPGGRAQIRLPDGSTYPMVETQVLERAEGFMQDQAVAPRTVSEYAGTFPVTAPLRVPGDSVRPTLVAGQDGAGVAVVELFQADLPADTQPGRAAVPLTVAVMREGDTRVAVASANRPGGMAIGTAVPGSGTPYHWFFPNGTRLTVTGEREGAYRVRLTSDLSVWVAAGDVRLMPEGAPPAAGTVGTVRVDPEPGYVDVRLVTSDRLPFEVRAGERSMEIRVYGAESRANWLHYGTEDPLVRRVEWQQERDDLFVVRMELAEPVWGYRAFWDERGSLVVRVRRPPRIDGARPMQGLRIAVDAGHPPGGAMGPTGLQEAEANLAISKQLVRMLREAGAEVLETRPDEQPVDLGVRPQRAAEWDAHLLVSVHNNAFPDGVNPWENNGTSVFYNQPQSLGLARHMQRELLRELGMRDLGIARADLALVRPTWMPSVLTETMFLMVPQQEAALRNPAVHERIARAHFRAIEAFLRERMAETAR
ncbi:MAG TPA: N-acetylmuramoyl-L-alanine amidase [Longimicrobium sp.]|nr:N-acetylmuramoyl-L-alanine amidase [Longimicrobium sp.]